MTVQEMYVNTFSVFFCHHLQVLVESSEQWTLSPKQQTF